MKQKVWRKDGMKQIISSGWKEFDKQTNCISTGNVYARTQYSSFIRPWKETECNGFTNPEGHLMNFDLKPFRNFRIPKRIMEILKNKERNESYILYMFFIVNKEKHVEPFGWVVTDYHYKYVESCVTRNYKQSYWRRYNALQEAISYITE